MKEMRKEQMKDNRKETRKAPRTEKIEERKTEQRKEHQNGQRKGPERGTLRDHKTPMKGERWTNSEDCSKPTQLEVFCKRHLYKYPEAGDHRGVQAGDARISVSSGASLSCGVRHIRVSLVQ